MRDTISTPPTPGITTSVTIDVERRAILVELPHPLGAVGGLEHREAAALEQAPRLRAHARLILHEQHASRAAHFSRLLDARERCSARATLGTAGQEHGRRACPSPARWRVALPPPDWRAIPYTVASPSPVPSCGPLVVKNGSKARSSVLSSIPTPVSLTSSEA